MNDSVKIILAGDFGVGKTCLLLQWVEGKFVPDASTTVDSGRYSFVFWQSLLTR